MLRNFLFVGLGGAVGSALRYAIGLWASTYRASTFPWSTLIINITGSFVIGLLAGAVGRNEWMAASGWALLAVGLCGGFTTFSAFSLENVRLIQNGQTGVALAYTLISVIIGIVLCWAGYLITR